MAEGRYGLSWQIAPAELPELMGDPDSAKSQAAMKAMLGMVKIDIDGHPSGLRGRIDRTRMCAIAGPGVLAPASASGVRRTRRTGGARCR